jgi:hypothetical protein
MCAVFLLYFLFLVLILWPKYKDSQIRSFNDCKAAGYAVAESYPESCITKGGRHFVNQEQVNYLTVPEWGIRLNAVNIANKLHYIIKDSKLLITSDELNDFATQNKGCSIANKQVSIYREKDAKTAGKSSKLIKGYYYYGIKSSVSPCVGANIVKVKELNKKAFELQSAMPTYNDVQELTAM